MHKKKIAFGHQEMEFYALACISVNDVDVDCANRIASFLNQSVSLCVCVEENDVSNFFCCTSFELCAPR